MSDPEALSRSANTKVGALQLWPPSLEVELNNPSGQPMLMHWIAPKYASRPPPPVATIAELLTDANPDAITVGEPTMPPDEIATWRTSWLVLPEPGVSRVQTTCSAPSAERTL